MIFVIEDDLVMGRCVGEATKHDYEIFSNAIEAMNKISDGVLPDLIFLDVLLTGPDGFTFLNELVSYADTAKIPVVVVSSLDFRGKDLSGYGVVGFLHKDIMKPEEIFAYAEKYAK